jgi:methionyl aminopeptidase
MVSIKSPEEIEIMREGGEILAKIVKELGNQVKPGVTTMQLNKAAEDLVFRSGGKCSFKGYQGYPASLCTSINEEIVHAIPSDRIFMEGDIVSLDFGLLWKGFHTDMAVTVPVGKISSEKEKLMDVTQKALEIGIKKVKSGNYIGDISLAIQKYVEGEGFNLVRELCGHGIGRNIHEDPEVMNAVFMPIGKNNFKGKIQYQGDFAIKLKEGMVICIEPMVTVGDWHIKKGKDGFGYETKDGSMSCHFEHTIAVLKSGYKILTKI